MNTNLKPAPDTTPDARVEAAKVAIVAAQDTYSKAASLAEKLHHRSIQHAIKIAQEHQPYLDAWHEAAAKRRIAKSELVNARRAAKKIFDAFLLEA